MSNFIIFISIEVALISSMESQRKANWGKFMKKFLIFYYGLCCLWLISNGKNPMGGDSHLQFCFFLKKFYFKIRINNYLFLYFILIFYFNILIIIIFYYIYFNYFYYIFVFNYIFILSEKNF